MPNMVVHSPKGKRRVNFPMYARYAASHTPAQFAKVEAALARKKIY